MNHIVFAILLILLLILFCLIWMGMGGKLADLKVSLRYIAFALQLAWRPLRFAFVAIGMALTYMALALSVPFVGTFFWPAKMRARIPCPECDGSNTSEEMPQGPFGAQRYACRDCGESFQL